MIGSFVEGARVRADALAALTDEIGGEPLGRRVRALLIAQGRSSVPFTDADRA